MHGFDVMDRAPVGRHAEIDGGPVGIDSPAAAIGEERGMIEDVLEPYLIQQGFLMRTRAGAWRPFAWQHFGLTQPATPGRPNL